MRARRRSRSTTLRTMDTAPVADNDYQGLAPADPFAPGVVSQPISGPFNGARTSRTNETCQTAYICWRPSPACAGQRRGTIVNDDAQPGRRHCGYGFPRTIRVSSDKGNQRNLSRCAKKPAAAASFSGASSVPTAAVDFEHGARRRGDGDGKCWQWRGRVWFTSTLG